MAARALPSPSPFAFAPSALPFSATTTRTFAGAYLSGTIGLMELALPFHMHSLCTVHHNSQRSNLVTAHTYTAFTTTSRSILTGYNTPHLCGMSCPLLALPSPHLPSRETFPTLRTNWKYLGMENTLHYQLEILVNMPRLLHGTRFRACSCTAVENKQLLRSVFKKSSVDAGACNNSLLRTKRANPAVSRPV